jgi:hypothetical protein
MFWRIIPVFTCFGTVWGIAESAELRAKGKGLRFDVSG